MFWMLARFFGRVGGRVVEADLEELERAVGVELGDALGEAVQAVLLTRHGGQARGDDEVDGPGRARIREVLEDAVGGEAALVDGVRPPKKKNARWESGASSSVVTTGMPSPTTSSMPARGPRNPPAAG